MRSEQSQATHFDALIVGAGISGIGAGYYLSNHRPGMSFAILEGREEIGGTWSLFRYPGIRSDSDMATFGYGFKSWTHRNSIADARDILEYLYETVAEHRLAEHIRFGHTVIGAQFSRDQGTWTVTVERAGERLELTSRFLLLGTGYYDYESGYMPEFAGVEDFEGEVVHPQFWPDDLDYTGKRVVVIGSGATAVTLIPSMAEKTAHVTMLQRSPGYVMSIPRADPITNALNAVFGHRRAQRIVRRKNVAISRGLYKACRRFPRLMRGLLIANVRRLLPKGFDVDTHFTPSYAPWDQRLCFVPDADLFRAISAGRASVVTDRINRFTPRGILLASGQELVADIVVTATGLNMLAFGGIELAVDGRRVNLPETTVYKAMMLASVPNLAFATGYSNISWTLKVDLVWEHFCRLLDHMDSHGHAVVEPVLGDDEFDMDPTPMLDLAAGYVQRGIGQFPHGGSRGPWAIEQAYEFDVARLREGPVEDDALRFSAAPLAARAKALA